MDNPQKLCKDCANVRPSLAGEIDENARCALFQRAPDPVTGKGDSAYAGVARSSSAMCGASALKFQPKDASAEALAISSGLT